MNITNYSSNRLDPTMKRSILTESYSNIPTQNSHNRSSLSKRPSFTGTTTQFISVAQHPKTPKPTATSSNSNMPFGVQNFSMPAHYFHQSSYVNHSYQIQPIQTTIQPSKLNSSRIDSLSSKSQTSLSKVQLFNTRAQSHHFEDKKAKQPTIQQILQKLQKTIVQVEKHEQILKNSEFNSNCSQNLTNNNHFIAKIVQQSLKDYNKARQIQTNMNYNLLKNQIQSIKQQFSNFSNNRQVEDRIKKIGQSINRQIQKVNLQLRQNLSNMSEMQKKDRKKQVQKIRTQLEQQLQNYQRKLEQKIKVIKDQNEKLACSSSTQALFPAIKTRKQFIGDPILVKFATKVSITVKSCTRELEDMETVYKIDNQGYLLDSEGKYILNNKYQQIKLSTQQIEIIRQRGFLK